MVKHTQEILRQQSTNCLSVFDHFIGLAPKGLLIKKEKDTLWRRSGVFIVNFKHILHLVLVFLLLTLSR